MTEKNLPKTPPLVELIQDGLHLVKEMNDKIIKGEQSTLDAYLQNKSPEIDKLILDVEKTGLGSYVSGEVALVYDPEDHFHLEGDFYFRTPSGEWTKKSLKGKSIKMDWAFLPDEQAKLRRAVKIVHEYDKP